MTKRCTKCGEDKPQSAFWRRGGGSSTLRARCKDCTRDDNAIWERCNSAKSGRFRKRQSRLKLEYNITPAEYMTMLIAQTGRCAMCGACAKPERELSVDHNHATGQVRGLLCQNCNGGIALLNEDIGLLQAAIDYLKEDCE